MRAPEKTAMSDPAPSALLAKPVAAPTHIAVSDNLDFLELTMAQGHAVRLPADRLRAACKCAHCIRARIDGVFAQAFDGIAITEIAPIGDYAINIAFSDGHARGIYPWSLLLDLKPA
jgi:prepilin-type processing-associated H-X9-DG protein